MEYNSYDNLDFNYTRCVTKLQKQLPVFDYSFDLNKRVKKKEILAMSPIEGPKMHLSKPRIKNKSEVKKKPKKSKFLDRLDQSKEHVERSSSNKRLNSTSFDKILSKLDD